MYSYKEKIKTDREFYPINDIIISCESDRGRIISSAPFRRLQKRTQVFALELNAAIRTRLTHSLEVAQNARFIAKTILKKIDKNIIEGFEDPFITLCEMSSLLHDIGNPPFGHFGELAINEWMQKNLKQIFEPIKSNISLKNTLIKDLSSFDGNAQVVRIIYRLQRLNLSYSQIASIIKYTRGAFENKNNNLDYLSKKAGFFYSEKEFIENIQKKLNIKKYHRYPITYIMEAADDISYLSADLEDAVDKGILDLEKIVFLIKNETHSINAKYNTKNTLLLDIIQKNYARAKEKEDDPHQFNMFLTFVRAELIGKFVEYVSNIYILNHDSIFEGSFNSAILEYEPTNSFAQAIEILKNISYHNIYTNKSVQSLELKGYAILQGLFNIYKPILILTAEDFYKLCNQQKIIPTTIIVKNLFTRLPKKHLIAYTSSVAAIKDKRSFQALELYYRTRMLIDYISGMTDDFALHEYQMLSVS